MVEIISGFEPVTFRWKMYWKFFFCKIALILKYVYPFSTKLKIFSLNMFLHFLKLFKDCKFDYMFCGETVCLIGYHAKIGFQEKLERETPAANVDFTL